MFFGMHIYIYICIYSYHSPSLIFLDTLACWISIAWLYIVAENWVAGRGYFSAGVRKDVAANKGSYTGTKTVALFSFQNKTPFFICLLLIYGVWKGVVVGEQFSFCSVERLGGSLELAPSLTSRTDLVLALPCVIG